MLPRGGHADMRGQSIIGSYCSTYSIIIFQGSTRNSSIRKKLKKVYPYFWLFLDAGTGPSLMQYSPTRTTSVQAGDW